MAVASVVPWKKRKEMARCRCSGNYYVGDYRGRLPHIPSLLTLHRIETRKTLISAAFLITLSTPFVLADTITPIADVKRNMIVTVQGTVERIPDEDEFRLTDQSGSILVYVGPNWVPVDVGEAITVNGRVDDNLIGPPELYARSLTRADGTVVEFDLRYEDE
ncbi:MAG: hypothetical protein AB8B58_05295 [Roseobacter sp.]